MVIKDDNTISADIYVNPLNNGVQSDKDYGVENGHVDNCCWYQLNAAAQIVATTSVGNTVRFGESEDDNNQKISFLDNECISDNLAIQKMKFTKPLLEDQVRNQLRNMQRPAKKLLT